ncbi:restriction endonuclease [Paenibacillus protaetiae]|uniref:Restriction endonuclease type IV Mrr domain-containing protein n=1 Tax=Paenibacillus protaetiae TaxID=2509456 RepID=A0A4P6EZJ0_9BACL|nr:restriction endonuclease [Paenibacillus protaetiae]QAY68514.1 hypothetical protein ET464_13745 [Paenibacillus protaetiae]
MQTFPKDITDAMRTCILAIFWPKEQIVDFLKNNGCTNRDLKTVLSQGLENKNRAAIIDEVFGQLNARDDKGIGQFRAMLASIINWDHFDPYYFKQLKRLDEAEAKRCINHLKQVQEIRDAKTKELRKQADERRAAAAPKISLVDLETEFINLYRGYSSNQNRGYQLETLLKKLSDFSNLSFSEPFKLNGEQLDGSLKLDGENYLVEAKWHDSLTASDALYHFAYKVEGKMYGRGLFISINGYSRDAVKALIAGKSIKTILIDGGDLSMVFSGTIPFFEMLDAKIRAAQTKGLIYIDPLNFKSKIE